MKDLGGMVSKLAAMVFVLAKPECEFLARDNVNNPFLNRASCHCRKAKAPQPQS